MVLLFLILCIGVVVYLFVNSNNEKAKNLEIVNRLYPAIEKSLNIFEGFTNYESGYFNHKKLVQWETKALENYIGLKDIPYKKLGLSPGTVSTIEKFEFKFLGRQGIRDKYNSAFINHELQNYASFFDNVEGKRLDLQQRKAVIIDEDNNLVVAGAGSGKTTTIAGKVSYLIKRFSINPDDILLISFTRKASDEMKVRIKKKMSIDIGVMTFHKFGLDVIASVTGKKPSIFDESKTGKVLKEIFDDLIKDHEYLSKVTNYFLNYSKPYKEENEFDSHGAYVQYIKDNNIKSLKQVSVQIGGKKTLLRESCKSIEEVIIANYLFLNNISYVYEKKYKHDTATKEYAQYKPDFYLPDYDIYIEHFGIDDFGNTPQWFGGEFHEEKNKEYKDGIQWKRKLHKEKCTNLIETYSFEKHKGTLLTNLSKKLEALGVEINPKTDEEIWTILEESAEDEILSFGQLLSTFLTLFKSNNYSVEDAINRNKEIYTGGELIRNSIFLDIFLPILQRYNAYLKEIEEIDFSDMINQATSYVVNGNYKKRFKYVIIDEFQDISIGRYKLIKAILDTNSGCKLFCVGDDWQSIYRFSGSDISIFTDFEKHFGTTEKTFIETTYRFNEDLISLSSDFILKNPKQVKKQLKTTQIANGNLSYEIIASDSFSNKDTETIKTALRSISSNRTQDSPSRVLLLGRYSHDIDFLKSDKENFSVIWNIAKDNFEIKFNESPKLEIDFLSVHKSKGLEADYVVLLNCNSGKFGFPSEQADDRILNLLLSQADQYPNGEERRLFYVALTRCKEKVFLLTKSKSKSKFIVELEKGKVNEIHCPQCKTGMLNEKAGKSPNGYEWRNLSCSNWSWGCDFIKWL